MQIIQRRLRREWGGSRPLAFAVLAGTILCFLSLQNYRPGMPVSDFPRLPAAVADDLDRRGCNIVRGNNVISGYFSGLAQPDWAALCQQGGQASLLVYFCGR